MPNYNENTLVGEIITYQRSNKVIIENNLDQIPIITFMEQIISILPDNTKVIIGRTKCEDSLLNPYEELNLLNPVTDEIIGTAKYVDAQILLYSVYRHIANKRDSKLTITSEANYGEA